MSATRWLEVAAIFSEARERHRRAWLEYDEWDRVFGIWSDMGAMDGPEVGIPADLALGIGVTHRRIMAARKAGLSAKDEHFRHEWAIGHRGERREAWQARLDIGGDSAEPSW